MALFFCNHTLYKVTCLVCATAPTGKVTFYKVPEKHGHVQGDQLNTGHPVPYLVLSRVICKHTTRPHKHVRVVLVPCKKQRLCTLLYTVYNGQFTRYQNNTAMYNWSPGKRFWIRYCNWSVLRL